MQQLTSTSRILVVEDDESTRRPKKDCLQLLGEIRGNPHSKHIPFVLMSDAMDEVLERKAYCIGADACVMKSSELLPFTKAIRRAFAAHP